MSLEKLVAHLVSTYGRWLVAVIVGLESGEVALSGETTLVAARLYAAASWE